MVKEFSKDLVLDLPTDSSQLVDYAELGIRFVVSEVLVGVVLSVNVRNAPSGLPDREPSIYWKVEK